jgi:hypothetical protein
LVRSLGLGVSLLGLGLALGEEFGLLVPRGGRSGPREVLVVDLFVNLETYKHAFSIYANKLTETLDKSIFVEVAIT